ncbi:MAG: hypothetical protein AAF999_12675 [Pseudomonadota bacterium]
MPYNEIAKKLDVSEGTVPMACARTAICAWLRWLIPLQIKTSIF